MRVNQRGRLLLLLILLVGMALRLYQLGLDSLWYDETVSVYLAGSPLAELTRHTAGDIHPPGYYILLRAWLILMSYPTGHADPHGIGLEFAAGFFSLFFGILLIVLAYTLARSVSTRAAALVAAAVVAFSPYNVWYSQEVRMYTLGAALGALTLYALVRVTSLAETFDSDDPQRPPWATRDGRPYISRRRPSPALVWWIVYALAAVAGLYTLYYFAFLLIPLNLCALIWLIRPNTHHASRITLALAPWPVCHRQDRQPRGPGFHASALTLWLLANFAILLLYVPWIPIAWRQATSPPVPPWRAGMVLWPALQESWTALSLGQAAPNWVWPALLIVLVVYVIGLVALLQPSARESLNEADLLHEKRRVAASFLPIATFGPLVLILLISATLTPVYHVRYMFTYSPAFYVVLAAGLVWLWRRWKLVAGMIAAGWLVAAAVTLYAFWHDPKFRADDHRSAVAFLQSRWRPGDVVLVNAGYAYPALLTYWQGSVDGRVRLTEELPSPRSDPALVTVMTGHVDGNADLGWGNPRSDFFAMPSDVAQTQVSTLLKQFPRVWHYRIYDTVNDPRGEVRAELDEAGQLIEDQVFPGEASLRVQGFVPRRVAPWVAGAPTVSYGAGLSAQWESLPGEVTAGQAIYPALTWRVGMQPAADVATSLRLIGPDGTNWAQPPDEHPLGTLFPASRWPAGSTQRQPLALPIPPGTPPGDYAVELVVYDPVSGHPWLAQGQAVATPTPTTRDGLLLGKVTVTRAEPPSSSLPAQARFGPLTLVEATTPATIVAPRSQIPVELLWQATEPPGEPLVVVVQLLDNRDRVVAGLEEQPLGGRYPTEQWTVNELIRDRHTLTVPENTPAGIYRLVAGVYRAADRQRLPTPRGLFGKSDYFVIKPVEVG